MAVSHSGLTRRGALGVLAGGALSISAGPAFAAGSSRIHALISAARAYSRVGERMDFISRSLLGTKYKAFTLIGGPQTPERMVVRDDAFDCVTFCETVLAAALAHDGKQFEPLLKQIRYRNGIVAWKERNHYWYEWCERNIDNHVCRAVTLDGSAPVSKTLNDPPQLGKRMVTFSGIPRGTVLANKDRLQTGDVIGFVSNRPSLDFFHTGLIVLGGKGDLLLRHCARSRGKAVEDRLDGFLALYGVRYVSLLRPEPRA